MLIKIAIRRMYLRGEETIFKQFLFNLNQKGKQNENT